MGRRRGPLAPEPEPARPVTRSQTQPRRSCRHAQRANSRGQSRVQLLRPVRHQAQISEASHQPGRILAVAIPQEVEEHLSGRDNGATSSAVPANNTSTSSFPPIPQELLSNRAAVQQTSALIPFSSSIQDQTRAISSLTHSMDHLCLDTTDPALLSQQVSQVRVEYSRVTNLIRKETLEPPVPRLHHQQQNQQLLITALAGLHRRFDRLEALLLSHDGGNF